MTLYEHIVAIIVASVWPGLSRGVTGVANEEIWGRMRQGEVSSIFCLISNSIYYPRCSLYISPPRAETYHQVITLPILKLTPKYQKVFLLQKKGICVSVSFDNEEQWVMSVDRSLDDRGILLVSPRDCGIMSRGENAVQNKCAAGMQLDDVVGDGKM